ncbi:MULTISPECIES: hypothetical protein [Lysobacteraceae]|uniref:hypothetical protein n=1 Tax=Lysobacteraceae TaxID=32033 RepID=UPI001BCF29E4|nr:MULTISPECIES: hypothetical protein [Lysobacter]
MEHMVTERFRANGWSVISNRYYVDDTDGKARELDLIAYRVFEVQGYEFVTTVLASCKKERTTTWAFLSRDKRGQDPNIEWQPVHYWTDIEPLRTFLSSSDWRSNYLESNRQAKAVTFNITRDVFAFQVIAPPGPRQGGSPEGTRKEAASRNDSPIFNSISGLMKALDYEIEAIPDRAAQRAFAGKRIYLFRLAVIVDAPMVDVQHSEKTPNVVEIDQLLLLTRYMVRKRHLDAQVHFVGADKVDWFIGEMESLATYNSEHLHLLLNESYTSIASNRAVQNYFATVLRKRLIHAFNYRLSSEGLKEGVSELFVMPDESGGIILEVDVDDDTADFLNSDSRTRLLVEAALKQEARFTGSFQIRPDLPF